jgi:tripartite-type tricarboxylate transporter receptor subunit TctC
VFVRNALRAAAVSLVSFGFLAPVSAAQKDVAADYPNGPIRFIVPFQAGGGTDLTVRVIGQKLTERWGQQIVADNRTGAAGSIAVDTTARAIPNGYTICIISASQAVNSAVNTKLPYDLTRDVQAVGQVTSLFYMVTLNPSVPAMSIKELIAYARANPGKLDYGSSGTFGLQHLAGELLQHLTGTKLVHVPYKGGAAALADVVSGQIKMGFNLLSTARPFMKTGRIRVLAVTTRTRSAALPEVPTLAEAGVSGFEVDQWYGIITSAKVPRPIVDKLSATISEAVRAPDVVQRLSADGSTTIGSTPEAFASHLKAEIVKWRNLAKATGLQME